MLATVELCLFLSAIRVATTGADQLRRLHRFRSAGEARSFSRSRCCPRIPEDHQRAPAPSPCWPSDPDARSRTCGDCPTHGGTPRFRRVRSSLVEPDHLQRQLPGSREERRCRLLRVRASPRRVAVRRHFAQTGRSGPALERPIRKACARQACRAAAEKFGLNSEQEGGVTFDVVGERRTILGERRNQLRVLAVRRGRRRGVRTGRSRT
jgi:hypothetical protein